MTVLNSLTDCQLFIMGRKYDRNIHQYYTFSSCGAWKALSQEGIPQTEPNQPLTIIEDREPCQQLTVGMEQSKN